MGRKGGVKIAVTSKRGCNSSYLMLAKAILHQVFIPQVKRRNLLLLSRLIEGIYRGPTIGRNTKDLLHRSHLTVVIKHLALLNRFKPIPDEEQHSACCSAVERLHRNPVNMAQGMHSILS